MGGGGSFVPEQWNWQFFDDASPDTSMTQLANENNTPTLTSDIIVRLRITLAETGGKADNSYTLELQYDTDSGFSSPQSLGAAPQHWNYVDGAATEGGTVDTLLLSDSTVNGEYCESGANAVSLGANEELECDIAIKATSAISYDTTYYFRVVGDATVIPLGTGESHPNIITFSEPTDVNIVSVIISS